MSRPNEISGSPGRCFWTKFKLDGKTLDTFVPLCPGAIERGRPDECSCDGREREIERLQAELRDARQRAATAEAYVDRQRAGIVELRRSTRAWEAKARARIQSEWAELNAARGGSRG